MEGVPDKILTWQMVQPTSRNRETKEIQDRQAERSHYSRRQWLLGRSQYGDGSEI